MSQMFLGFGTQPEVSDEERTRRYYELKGQAAVLELEANETRSEARRARLLADVAAKDEEADALGRP